MSIHRREKINDIFSAAYEKMEREKLNKMVYLHSGFQSAKYVLFVKYFMRNNMAKNLIRKLITSCRNGSRTNFEIYWLFMILQRESDAPDGFYYQNAIE